MKKILAIVTSITCAVWLAGPGVANAYTVEELQAQINALLAQLSQLQSQLAQLQGQQPTSNITGCTITSFTRNLKQGMTGDDVKCLQIVLNSDADTQVATTGAGSPGNETTYFGAKTKAAVIKFQEKYASEVLTPLGLTKGTGFVGASTRAKLNSILAGGVVPTPPPPPTTPTPAGVLNVALAPDTPASATIIADTTNGGQALVNALKLRFTTAPGSQAKITQLVLKRIGIATDSDIDNVYLYDGATKLAEMTSISSGTVTFTNLDLLVEGEKNIDVKFDLNKDTNAGKTIGFQVAAAADITTDGATVSGTFPISGNLMTVATVNDLGQLTITTLGNASTVDPGTTDFEAMRFSLSASNQNIKLYRIKFLMLGSVSSDDIKNLKLYDGATALASVEKLASDRTVTFDLSASPLTIQNGTTKTLSLRIDVVGGSTRTIQFSIQRVTDIEAMDANYNVYVRVYNFSIQNSTATTVNAGTLFVTKASDSPSGNVALNATNVSLLKLNLQALGEGIKVSSLKFRIANGSSGNTWTNIKNVKLIYDGYQVGQTQNTVTRSTDYIVAVNFTIPVGATKTLEIRADIASASGATTPISDGDTIVASLKASTGNGQRVVSLGTVDVPSTDQDGNELTVSSAALSAAKNNSVGAITLVKGATNQRIASFLLTAGAAEGVDVSSITFEDGKTNDTTNGTYALGSAFTNLKLMTGNTQLGSTKITSPLDADTTQYTFYLSPALTVPAGQSVQIDLYADVLSEGIWANGEWVQLDSATGTGKISNVAANITSANSKAGQAITLVTGGTLSVAVDTSTPMPTQLVAGSTEQTLAVWKFSASAVEDLLLTQLAVENLNSAGDGNVRNLKLFVGGSQVGSTVPALDTNHQAWFRNLNISIPRGGNTLVTLKGDITPYAEGLSAGDYLLFKVRTPGSITGSSTETITAKGATSGKYASLANPNTDYITNAQYPYRTILTASLSTTKLASGNTRSSNDNVAKLTLTGTASGEVQFRPSNEANDEAPTNWIAIDADGNVGTDTTHIDGTYSIKSVSGENTASALAYDFGAGVPANYSMASLWLRPTVSGGSSSYTFVVCSDSTLSTCQQSTALSVTDGAWNFVNVALSGLTSASRYVGVKATAAGGSNTVTMLIDNMRLYNDSMTIDVAGNLNSPAPIGTPFYLKFGGTTVATGYYTGSNTSGTVTLIPDTLISIGGNSTTFDIYTSTLALMATDTTGTEVLSLNMDMGSVTAGASPTVTAGDFRWYDQAVSATSPITWINPSGGSTTVSMGY